ncbi:MAG: pilus assembly protein PilP [Desulfobulbaceae bacterium]|nr:pilus assembly protein PilP [Desulfobulbaceae bacterium]
MLPTNFMKRENSLKTCLHYSATRTIIAVLFAVAMPMNSYAQITTPNTDVTKAAIAEEPNTDGTEAAIAENLKVNEALKDLIDSMELKPFTYQTEGRTDPFLPFISQKVMQEVAETKPEILTGMRQFEPGQLTLVSIIFSGNSAMAMVEDSSHKGYIVRKGTKIGRSGIISNILPNQVIIKQLSYSMAKQKKYKTVEMTLRKEGEK